jgi:glutathione S-transferase
MSKLVIYVANKNYSSWSMRPWLALKQTGAAFDEEVVPLDEPTTREEILKRSPSGKLPALRDGDTVVWDSLAIGEYLAERFPAAKLWPADAGARAKPPPQ